jgi:hypothetical protein
VYVLVPLIIGGLKGRRPCTNNIATVILEKKIACREGTLNWKFGGTKDCFRNEEMMQENEVKMTE